MDWIQIVSSLGFPIASSVALAFFVYKAFQMFFDSSKEREERLYNTISQTQSALKEAGETNARFVDILTEMKNDMISVRKDVDDIKETLKKGDEKNECTD